MRGLMCVVALWPSVLLAQSLPATLVARTGQDVPGLPGATFQLLQVSPRIGMGGHVAFSGSISGGGVVSANDFGYWAGLPGTLETVIREDTQSGGPELFSGTVNIGVDLHGDVSLWTRLSAPTPINTNEILYGFLPDGSGGATTVARKGETSPPGFGSGALFGTINAGHASNPLGDIAFTGTAFGGDAIATTDLGLFRSTAAGLALIAREGIAAPNATGTAPVFASFLDKRINGAGQIGFATALTGAGVNAINDRAIYVWSPNDDDGTLALAAQTGNVAPGTSATIKFATLDDQPGFSESGQVVFRGSLTSDTPGEITLSNNFGIWAGTPGDVQLVARSGTASPIAGLTMRTPEMAPRINAHGDVAFVSLVSGFGVNTANDRVIWLSTDQGIVAVAREGTAAAGAGTGVNFAVLDPTVALNAQSHVAFTASLTGTGITTANDRGLWAGAAGALSLIAREGDVLDLDPSAGELLKTIQTISFASGIGSPPAESASSGLNDAGQIAWRAQFTDSTTAIFVTSLPVTFTGDYNDDGIVDAADYTVWRDTEGTIGVGLAADGNFDGFVDQLDYDIWKATFGTVSAGILATKSGAVPEPGTVLLGCCVVAVLTCTSLRNRLPLATNRV